MFCPYCATEKDAQEFTDEHVLPRALRRAVHPTSPFKLRLCQQCNAIAGLYVDTPVVRSWLLRLARASALIDPLDPLNLARSCALTSRLADAAPAGFERPGFHAERENAMLCGHG